MAWRAIQDTVGQSESLAELSHLAERIYWRLLAHSDPWGRLDARPRKLRARCWPMLGVSDEEVGYALLEIESVGRIFVYERESEVVVQIVDFEANQPRDAIRRRPDKSRLPDPPRGAAGQRPAVRRTGSEDATTGSNGLIASVFGLRANIAQESMRFAGSSGQSPAAPRTESGSAADTVRGEETETEKEKRREEPLRASERELQDAHRSPAEDRTPEEEPVVRDLPDERLGAMAGSVRSELERLRPRGATA